MKIHREEIGYTFPGYYPIVTYITTNVQPNTENRPENIYSSSSFEGYHTVICNTIITKTEITLVILDTYLKHN